MVLISKPIVSSIIYKMLSLVSNIRLGRKELPMIIEGDRKEVRSAYSEQSGITDKDLAIKLRTESYLQVYLPCLRYILQPDTICCEVSGLRQKEHADD